MRSRSVGRAILAAGVVRSIPGCHGPIMAGSMSDIYAYFARHSKR